MALPDTLKLAAATSRTSGISSQSIATAAAYTGSAIDNSTNKDAYLTAECVWSYAVAPTANKSIELYLIYAPSGTDEDEHNGALIGSFSPPADTSSHRRVILKSVPLLPFSFKIRAKNVDTGQSITLTVNAWTHNDQVVD